MVQIPITTPDGMVTIGYFNPRHVACVVRISKDTEIYVVQAGRFLTELTPDNVMRLLRGEASFG